jgi:hypothetical protein
MNELRNIFDLVFGNNFPESNISKQGNMKDSSIIEMKNVEHIPGTSFISTILTGLIDIFPIEHLSFEQQYFILHHNKCISSYMTVHPRVLIRVTDIIIINKNSRNKLIQFLHLFYKINAFENFDFRQELTLAVNKVCRRLRNRIPINLCISLLPQYDISEVRDQLIQDVKAGEPLLSDQFEELSIENYASDPELMQLLLENYPFSFGWKNVINPAILQRAESSVRIKLIQQWFEDHLLAFPTTQKVVESSLIFSAFFVLGLMDSDNIEANELFLKLYRYGKQYLWNTNANTVPIDIFMWNWSKNRIPHEEAMQDLKQILDVGCKNAVSSSTRSCLEAICKDLLHVIDSLPDDILERVVFQQIYFEFPFDVAELLQLWKRNKVLVHRTLITVKSSGKHNIHHLQLLVQVIQQLPELEDQWELLSWILEVSTMKGDSGGSSTHIMFILEKIQDQILNKKSKIKLLAEKINLSAITQILRHGKDIGFELYSCLSVERKRGVLTLLLRHMSIFMNNDTHGTLYLRSMFSKVLSFLEKEISLQQAEPYFDGWQAIENECSSLGITRQQYLRRSLRSDRAPHYLHELLKIYEINSFEPSPNSVQLYSIVGLERHTTVPIPPKYNDPIRVPWSQTPEWDTFSKIILPVVNPIYIVIGDHTAPIEERPVDLGGPKREYYNLLAQDMIHNTSLFESLDGYLIPSSNASEEECYQLAQFIIRARYIDQVRPELPLHPAFLTILAYDSLFMTASDILQIIFEEYTDLLSPRFKFTHSFRDLIDDIHKRYPRHFKNMGTIGQIFSKELGKRNLHSFLSFWSLRDSFYGHQQVEIHRVCQGIIQSTFKELNEICKERILLIVQVLEKILGTWKINDLQDLWRFWFGTLRLDNNESVNVVLIKAHENEDMNLAKSHTCNNTLDLPLPKKYMNQIELISSEDEILCKWLDELLRRSLETQRMFAACGAGFQMS